MKKLDEKGWIVEIEYRTQTGTKTETHYPKRYSEVTSLFVYAGKHPEHIIEIRAINAGRVRMSAQGYAYNDDIPF